ncbi:cyclase family protein [Fulvivirga lutea]|uniref:Cyclase family protein n=2 Tax=Fulvivirga lutea TaxID=2810512 RepID=A0A974WJ01_9BACT|nr:cyclase family protein [Fulvivirga lutea]
MIINFTHQGKTYQADLSQPIDISIPLNEGIQNPACYWADDVNFEVIKSGDFIGDVKQGGSVNHKKVTLTPHGNGTHTETYGHISSDENATIHNLLKEYHCLAELITIEPASVENGDRLLTIDSFNEKRRYSTEAMIIRTLPNDQQKLSKKYSGTNPPYLDAKIAEELNQTGVRHLLVDLPSVDREVDGGKLSAHNAFWGSGSSIRKECTITELIYVDNKIDDGLYLLNLQTLNIVLDASPSRPVIYKLELY